MQYGKKVWIFPDAELPPAGVNAIPGHESIIVTNTADQTAHLTFTLPYEDREPVSFHTEVAARRVRCLRTNREADFAHILRTRASSTPSCWKVMFPSWRSTAELSREP